MPFFRKIKVMLTDRIYLLYKLVRSSVRYKYGKKIRREGDSLILSIKH